MRLSVALGTNIQSGPFGGGNQFAQSLMEYLQQQGVTVFFNLTQPSIDVILVTSVKPWARGATFDIVAALQYRKKYPRTAIILRVNDCDERKGHQVPLLNMLLQTSMKQVDHIVFVSQWLQELLLPGTPAKKLKSSVVRSGANPTMFNQIGRALWNGQEPLKIVTHHWSNSWYKGWDVYQELDNFLGTTAGRPYRFTFIGNPWPEAHLRHTLTLPPTTGFDLASLLKQHHIYISASLNEPAGMHYIEALQCGLPILWRKSGSLPEYCELYGPSFSDPQDFIYSLRQLRASYQRWHAAVNQHSYTATNMNHAYLKLLQKLHLQSVSTGRFSTLPLRLQQSLLWLRDSLT